MRHRSYLVRPSENEEPSNFSLHRTNVFTPASSIWQQHSHFAFFIPSQHKSDHINCDLLHCSLKKILGISRVSLLFIQKINTPIVFFLYPVNIKNNFIDYLLIAILRFFSSYLFKQQQTEWTKTAEESVPLRIRMKTIPLPRNLHPPHRHPPHNSYSRSRFNINCNSSCKHSFKRPRNAVRSKLIHDSFCSLHSSIERP